MFWARSLVKFSKKPQSFVNLLIVLSLILSSSPKVFADDLDDDTGLTWESGSKEILKEMVAPLVFWKTAGFFWSGAKAVINRGANQVTAREALAEAADLGLDTTGATTTTAEAAGITGGAATVVIGGLSATLASHSRLSISRSRKSQHYRYRIFFRDCPPIWVGLPNQ